MTAEAKHWHEVCETLNPVETKIIDGAYDEVRRVLSWDGRCQCANDDRAEELVAAITRYYKESLERHA